MRKNMSMRSAVIAESAGKEIFSEISSETSLEKELLKDTLSLFSGEKSGHMGKWYYSPQGNGGETAGTDIWRALEGCDNDYALMGEEEQMIASFSDVIGRLGLFRNLERVCELGPGGMHSVSQKSFRVLSLLDKLKTYMPVDTAMEFAVDAATLVKAKYNSTVVNPQRADIFDTQNIGYWPLLDLVMAFGVICNLELEQGQQAHTELTSLLAGIRRKISDKGFFLASYSMETDGEAIASAYMDENSQAFNLNLLTYIKRTLPISGLFEPSDWRYEPIWHSKAAQCAHTVYPVKNQVFTLGKRAFFIPAGKRLHLKSSYRFDSCHVRACAYDAGFQSVQIFEDGHNALLVASNDARAKKFDINDFNKVRIFPKKSVGA